jgi:hypothetical protein
MGDGIRLALQLRSIELIGLDVTTGDERTLALDVLLGGRTWRQAINENWRKTKSVEARMGIRASMKTKFT